MLSAHMDTVEPGRGIKPEVRGDRIVSDGTTILGATARREWRQSLRVCKALRRTVARDARCRWC